MQKNNFMARFLTRSILLIFLSFGMIVQALTVYASEQTDQESSCDQYMGHMIVAVKNQPCIEYDYVVGMDVSDNGGFLVVLRSGTTYYIDVYDSDLNFQNQIVLSSIGSLYVSFGQNDGELVIYFPKEQTKLNMKINGEYVSAATHEPVPVELMSQFVNGYKKITDSYLYCLQTRENVRTASVESEKGTIICQYSSSTNESVRYLLLLLLLILAALYIFIKNAKRRSTRFIIPPSGNDM